MVYLASRESMHLLRSGSRVGRRLPAHSTATGQVLLAQRSPEEVDIFCRPLSVMLPSIRDNVQINLFMAGLLISVVLPIVIFLLFQRYFIRGAGLAGGIKG